MMTSSIAEDANRFNQHHPSVVYGNPVARAYDYNNNMDRGTRHGYHPNDDDDDVRCLCLERIISIGIVCMLGFFLTWVLVVMVSVFDGIPEFQINYMLVSPLKISNSQISTNWTIGVLVTNTNFQSSMIYDGFEVSVFVDNIQYLCDTRFPAFQQGPRKQTNLIIGPKACSQGLTTPIIPAAAAGVAYFDVNLWVRYRHVLDRYMSWIWPGENWRKTIVHCTNLEVWFPSNGTQGTMIGNMKLCTV